MFLYCLNSKETQKKQLINTVPKVLVTLFSLPLLDFIFSFLNYSFVLLFSRPAYQGKPIVYSLLPHKPRSADATFNRTVRAKQSESVEPPAIHMTRTTVKFLQERRYSHPPETPIFTPIRHLYAHKHHEQHLVSLTQRDEGGGRSLRRRDEDQVNSSRRDASQ